VVKREVVKREGGEKRVWKRECGEKREVNGGKQ
jgi:hypothetical protein